MEGGEREKKRRKDERKRGMNERDNRERNEGEKDEREREPREDERETHTHSGILGIVECKIPGRREREQQK